MGKKRVAKTDGTTAVKEAEKQEEKVEKKAKKKKKGRVVERANIYVKASYNNTSIYVADEKGDTIAWNTAGSSGFKGPRKATPFAATQVVNILMDKLERVDMKSVHIFVQGIGSGRDSAVRALTSKNLNVVSIKDITPLPHNGCRAPKRRRV